jgi:hypothetical protein
LINPGDQKAFQINHRNLLELGCKPNYLSIQVSERGFLVKSFLGASS